MTLLACTRADQLKPQLWADFNKLTSDTFINNLADAHAKNEAQAQEIARLTAEIAELKKKAEPQPVILTPPVPPPTP